MTCAYLFIFGSVDIKLKTSDFSFWNDCINELNCVEVGLSDHSPNGTKELDERF